MSKFSNSKTKKTFATSKAATSGIVMPTHEGGVGYDKDDKTALYTLAVTNMVGEATFYESGDERDNRFANLVHRVTLQDPEWITSFIKFLRNEANMRSASIIVAAEAAKVLIYLRSEGVEINGNVRSIIDSACVRADEPAEMLGYWLSTQGRKLPAGVKRGIADASVRLYNERNALKYDGNSRGIRMGDVLNLVHPKPISAEQGDLFGYVMDKRYGRVQEIPESLEMIRAATELEAVPEEQRRDVLRERGPEALSEAGFTWERLSGWLPGGMDAEAWEAIIPSMGYMALLRNIRNFEEQKVSKAVLNQVAAKLADPDEVARSRQFPYRFFTAWKASGSIMFGPALETAMDLSVQNIPVFSGRTLVAIDTSASMNSPVSDRSQAHCYEVAALFGSAVAARSDADIMIYADSGAFVPPKTSVLRGVEDIRNRIGQVGHGTQTWPSVKAALAQNHYDRVCVFTDMQDHPNRPYGYYGSDHNPVDLPDIPVYVWDLRGYQRSNVNLNTPGRYLFGGFTDAAFKLISLIEQGQNVGWPWEQ